MLPAQQRNVLRIAYNSAVQMLDMINALLDISRWSQAGCRWSEAVLNAPAA